MQSARGATVQGETSTALIPPGKNRSTMSTHQQGLPGWRQRTFWRCQLNPTIWQERAKGRGMLCVFSVHFVLRNRNSREIVMLCSYPPGHKLTELELWNLKVYYSPKKAETADLVCFNSWQLLDWEVAHVCWSRIEQKLNLLPLKHQNLPFLTQRTLTQCRMMSELTIGSAAPWKSDCPSPSYTNAHKHVFQKYWLGIFTPCQTWGLQTTPFVNPF